MTETEKITVGGLLTALVLIVPGFLLHVSPRFPGSMTGGIIGISAALLFFLLLVYWIAKRVPWVKERTKSTVSIGTLLTFHVYAGAIGALLGIVHSGHKFESPLGIALVLAMLTVVATGFIGRYYLAQIGVELRDQQKALGILRTEYDAMILGAHPTFALDAGSIDERLGAMSDLEFQIGTREVLKNALGRWVVLHIVSAIVMYALLALHIWSGVYYGLRWLG